jgi:hypothetical protein
MDGGSVCLFDLLGILLHGDCRVAIQENEINCTERRIDLKARWFIELVS